MNVGRLDIWKKEYFKVVLAMMGYKLLGYTGCKYVVGISLATGVYTFWYIGFCGKLIFFGSCNSRDEAEFRYKVLIPMHGRVLY